MHNRPEPGAFLLPCTRGRPGGGVPESGTLPCPAGCEPPPGLPRVQGRKKAPGEISCRSPVAAHPGGDEPCPYIQTSYSGEAYLPSQRFFFTQAPPPSAPIPPTTAPRSRDRARREPRRSCPWCGG